MYIYGREGMLKYGEREVRWRARHRGGETVGVTLPAALVRDFGLRPGDVVEVEGDPAVGEIRLRVVQRAAWRVREWGREEVEELEELVAEAEHRELAEMEELVREVM